MSTNATSFLRYGVYRLDTQDARVANEVCPICYDRLGEAGSPVQIIACHHHFCTHCLTSHVSGRRRNRNTCPICRAQLFDRDLYEGHRMVTRRAPGDRAAGVHAAFDEISDRLHRSVIVERGDVVVERLLNSRSGGIYLEFLNENGLLGQLYGYSSDEDQENGWSGSEDDYIEEFEDDYLEVFEDEEGEEGDFDQEDVDMNDNYSDGPDHHSVDLPFSLPTREQAIASLPRIGFDDNDQTHDGDVHGPRLNVLMVSRLCNELAELRRQLSALDARAIQLQNNLAAPFASSSHHGGTVQSTDLLPTHTLRHDFLALEGRMDTLEAAVNVSRPLRSRHRVVAAGITDFQRRPARNGRARLARPGVHPRRRFIADSIDLESDSDEKDGSDSDSAEGSQLGVPLETGIEAMSNSTSEIGSNSSWETDPDKYDEDDALQVSHNARYVPAADTTLVCTGEEDDEEDSDHFEEYYDMMDEDADNECDDELSDDDMDGVFEN